MEIQGPINGFIYVKCPNCKIKKLFDEDIFLELKKQFNFIFCNPGCKISYQMNNQHIKIHKYNKENQGQNFDNTCSPIEGTLNRGFLQLKNNYNYIISSAN